jgi:hypothetical protein
MLATDSLLYVDQIGTLVPCSCVEEYLSLIDTDSVILQNMNLIEDVYILDENRNFIQKLFS